jgi:hypothetical protein
VELRLLVSEDQVDPLPVNPFLLVPEALGTKLLETLLLGLRRSRGIGGPESVATCVEPKFKFPSPPADGDQSLIEEAPEPTLPQEEPEDHGHHHQVCLGDHLATAEAGQGPGPGTLLDESSGEGILESLDHQTGLRRSEVPIVLGGGVGNVVVVVVA